MKTTLLTILLAAVSALTAAAQSQPPLDTITVKAEDVIETFSNLPGGNYYVKVEGDLKDRLKWELDEEDKFLCPPELRWTLHQDVLIYYLDLSKTTGLDSIKAVNWVYYYSKNPDKPPFQDDIGCLILPDDIEYVNMEDPKTIQFGASENSRKFSSKDFFLLTKDGKTVLYYRLKNRKEKKVPEGVETIASGAIGIYEYDQFLQRVKRQRLLKLRAALGGEIDSTELEEINPEYGRIDLILPKSLKRLEKNSITEEYTDYRWHFEIPENVEYVHPSLFKYVTKFSPGNKFYTVKDSIIYDGKMTRVIDGTHFNGQLVLPKTVREIDSGAFDHNLKLSAVTLPKKLKKIGYCAFRNSGIKEITLPKGLETIDAEAFYGTGILNVDIPGSVKKISRYAFGGYYCYAGDDTIKIKLNPGTETIDDYAFHYRDQGFNMIVTVPSTVKYIGSNTLSIGRNIYYSFEDTQNWHCAFNESDWKNRINGVPLTQIEFPDYIYSGIYSIDNTEYDKVSLDNAMLKLFTAVGIFFNIEQEYYDDEDNLTDSDVINRLDYLYQPTYEDENAHKNDDFIFQYSVDSTDDDEQPCKLKIEILRPYFYKL